MPQLHCESEPEEEESPPGLPQGAAAQEPEEPESDSDDVPDEAESDECMQEDDVAELVADSSGGDSAEDSDDEVERLAQAACEPQLQPERRRLRAVLRARQQARARGGRAGQSRRVLHLFSGPQERSDGLAAALRELGWAVDEVDKQYGDCYGEDLLQDGVFEALLELAEAGHYRVVVAGVPCSTFSVARFRRNSGPPVVRRRTTGEARGLREPPPGHELEAEQANELAARACRICEAVWLAGGEYVLENPIDRSCATLSARLRLGLWPDHVSLWQLAELRSLRRTTRGRYVHFPQCALGGLAQKWTTLLYSPGLDALADLGQLRCSHSRGQHKRRGIGRDASGAWESAALAAYPTRMNLVIAAAIDQLEPAPPAEAMAETAEQYWRPGEACLWLPPDAADTTEGVAGVIFRVAASGSEVRYDVETPGRLVRGVRGEQLRGVPLVGSAKPHAAAAEAAEARSKPHEASASSLRRNEPELESVLLDEPLPQVNVPPRTDWFEVAADEDVPGPLTTDELIPAEVQRRVARHVARVRACYARARRGPHGWRVARDMRPPPLELSEEEAVLPAGRGWSWLQGEDGLWRPLTRSRWPEDPPETDLDIAAVLETARADPERFGESDRPFLDQYVLACMAHGHPAPHLVRAVVLGYPHVGALKSMEALDKCIEKDRKQDRVPGRRPWTEHGGDMPQVWPVRADPINVAWRGGKPRITIDKTMGLSELFEAYNAAVHLEEYDPVEMVRVEQLCRAVAILRSAGVGVRVWSFDLEAYFRKSAKQRADWWKSGYLLPDGAGFDKRIQFGQREAPNLTSRQSNFIVWAMRRELHAFDAAHPPVEPRLLAWRLLRSLLERPGRTGGFDCVYAALYFIMQFVDDVGAASSDDLLYTRGGAPYWARWCASGERYVACAAGEGGAVHLRRPDAHYTVALSVVERLGHASAAGKGVPPCDRMDLLGAHIDVPGDRRMLTKAKCSAYSAAVRELLAAPPVASGALRVPFAAFNSVIHKLLHASATVVLGRQHLHYCMAARKASNRLAGAYALLHASQVAELEWWLEQLEDPTRHCLPLASRVVFPDVAETAVVCSYSDAARELQSPLESGYGAWSVIDGTFCWLAGLWTEEELRAHSISVLELAAENFGTFAFIAHARRLGLEVTHAVDFVDNTAAEYSADRGRPDAPPMRELVRQRYDALDDLGVYSSVERITSADNEWADALSRGPQRVQDVLRMARALGMPTRELVPEPAWRDLSQLPRSDA